MRKLAATLLLSSCNPFYGGPPTPPIVEVAFADARDRVVVEMIVEQNGFPTDTVVSYEIRVEHRSGGRDVALAGRAQIQSVHARVHAQRLSSGVMAIALGTELCITGPAIACVDLDSAPAPASMRDALVWRGGADQADVRERARAAIALVPLDRDAALEALEALDGRDYADGSVDAELRGVRARLHRDDVAIEQLCAEMATGSGMFLEGLARACVLELEPDLRAALVDRPASVRSLVEPRIAACRVHPP